MENLYRFHKNLSAFLSLRRWNTEDLAGKTGLAPYTIHYFLTDMQIPTEEQFEKILKAFKLSAEDFQNPEKFRGTDWNEWDIQNIPGFEKVSENVSVSVSKLDTTKPQVAYVLGGFHSVMLEVAECGTPDGKYAPYSWKNCKISDLLDAAGRHYLSYIGGELIDPEDNRPHIVKAIWNLCAARQLHIDSEKNEKEV
jgi:transcriptional regulator with XRE-family HTH domain